LLNRFSRSAVKGQGLSVAKCNFTADGGQPSTYGRQSVNTCFVISLYLVDGFQWKLAEIFIPHWTLLKNFQGQKSKVKVIATPNALLRRNYDITLHIWKSLFTRQSRSGSVTMNTQIIMKLTNLNMTMSTTQTM